MSSPLGDSIPYGVRDLKLTRYTDASGTVLAGTSVDLPNMQTLSFTEAEEFSELRGDDRLVATHGQGSTLEWSLEAGGISLAAWSIFTGGSVIESGVTPNRKRILRKMSTAIRPYFRAQGQIISESGGDLHVFLYRLRSTENVEGEFADGEFFVTSAGGTGLPLPFDTMDLLYDIIQNETAVGITTTPAYNPLAPPANLSAGALTATTAVLNWTPNLLGSGYQVYEKVAAGSYAAVVSGRGGVPSPGSATTTTITTLTTATQYTYKIQSTGNGGPSADSNEIVITTP